VCAHGSASAKQSETTFASKSTISEFALQPGNGSQPFFFHLHGAIPAQFIAVLLTPIETALVGGFRVVACLVGLLMRSTNERIVFQPPVCFLVAALDGVNLWVLIEEKMTPDCESDKFERWTVATF
jgi:hypothetical protein